MEKYTKNQNDTRRYLDAHDVERMFAQMLNNVVQKRASNPKVYLIKYLLERCNREELRLVQAAQQASKDALGRRAKEKDPNANEGEGISLPLHPESKAFVVNGLDKKLYATLRWEKSKSGYSLEDCLRIGKVHKDAETGLLALDRDCLDEFRPVFEQVLKSRLKVPNLNPVSVLGKYTAQMTKTPEAENLPPLYPHEMANLDSVRLAFVRLRVSRNLKAFALTPRISRTEQAQCESVIVDACMRASAELGLRGFYVTLHELSAAGPFLPLKQLLKSRRLWIDPDPLFDCASMADDWPESRGVWVLEDLSIAVWVNTSDHIKVVASESDGGRAGVKAIFRKTCAFLDKLHQHTVHVPTLEEGDDEDPKPMSPFSYDDMFGYVSYDPFNGGHGMRVSAGVRVPFTANDPNLLEDLKKTLSGLRMKLGKYTSPEEGIVEVVDIDRFTRDEAATLKLVISACNTLVERDNALREKQSFGWSMQVAQKKAAEKEQQAPEKEKGKDDEKATIKLGAPDLSLLSAKFASSNFADVVRAQLYAAQHETAWLMDSLLLPSFFYPKGSHGTVGVMPTPSTKAPPAGGSLVRNSEPTYFAPAPLGTIVPSAGLIPECQEFLNPLLSEFHRFRVASGLCGRSCLPPTFALPMQKKYLSVVWPFLGMEKHPAAGGGTEDSRGSTPTAAEDPRVSQTTPLAPCLDFSSGPAKGYPMDVFNDSAVLSLTAEVRRNLNGVAFVPSANLDDLLNAHTKIEGGLKLIEEAFRAEKPMSGTVTMIADSERLASGQVEYWGLLGTLPILSDFQHLSGFGKFWPEARCVYIPPGSKCSVMVNLSDHLHVRSTDGRGSAVRVLQRVYTLLGLLTCAMQAEVDRQKKEAERGEESESEEGENAGEEDEEEGSSRQKTPPINVAAPPIHNMFAFDERLGYIGPDLQGFGCGLSLGCRLFLPHVFAARAHDPSDANQGRILHKVLAQEIENICEHHRVSCSPVVAQRACPHSTGVVLVNNLSSIGVGMSEANVLFNFATAVSELLALEDMSKEACAQPLLRNKVGVKLVVEPRLALPSLPLLWRQRIDVLQPPLKYIFTLEWALKMQDKTDKYGYTLLDHVAAAVRLGAPPPTVALCSSKSLEVFGAVLDPLIGLSHHGVPFLAGTDADAAKEREKARAPMTICVEGNSGSGFYPADLTEDMCEGLVGRDDEELLPKTSLDRNKEKPEKGERKSEAKEEGEEEKKETEGEEGEKEDSEGRDTPESTQSADLCRVMDGFSPSGCPWSLVQRWNVSARRNLENFLFVPSIGSFDISGALKGLESLAGAETTLVEAAQKCSAFTGQEYTRIGALSDAAKRALAKDFRIDLDSPQLTASPCWPCHRGLMISSDGSVVFLINVVDHLTLLCGGPGRDVQSAVLAIRDVLVEMQTALGEREASRVQWDSGVLLNLRQVGRKSSSASAGSEESADEDDEDRDDTVFKSAVWAHDPSLRGFLGASSETGAWGCGMDMQVTIKLPSELSETPEWQAVTTNSTLIVKSAASGVLGDGGHEGDESGLLLTNKDADRSATISSRMQMVLSEPAVCLSVIETVRSLDTFYQTTFIDQATLPPPAKEQAKGEESGEGGGDGESGGDGGAESGKESETDA